MSDPQKPAFWTTTLAKALSGDQPCLLSPWLLGRGVTKRPKDDQASLTIWKTDHTAQLNAYVESLRSEGWSCSVERFFKVTGKAAILSGKADCIAQQPEKRPLIIDVKSGQPRDSDVVQVIIEQVMIPLAWERPELLFAGRVVYRDHAVQIGLEQAERLKPRIFEMLRWLGTATRPDAAQSYSACRFCDVSEKDCQQRVENMESAEATSELF